MAILFILEDGAHTQRTFVDIAPFPHKLLEHITSVYLRGSSSRSPCHEFIYKIIFHRARFVHRHWIQKLEQVCLLLILFGFRQRVRETQKNTAGNRERKLTSHDIADHRGQKLRKIHRSYMTSVYNDALPTCKTKLRPRDNGSSKYNTKRLYSAHKESHC